jgi:hypothetical protein
MWPRKKAAKKTASTPAPTANADIVFRRNPKNANQCFTDKSFVAERGGAVTFRFPEVPEAEIEFLLESPFHPAQELTFKFGADGVQKTVREDAPLRSYAYTIRWSETVQGAAGGQVRGSGGT